MNLSQFKDWAVKQGSVAKTDGTFKGECVSLINQYLDKVYGIKAGAWGNAKDWVTGRPLEHFDLVLTPQAGDILVYPTAGPYGHIEIYLGNNQSLGQNRHLDGRVYVDSLWTKYPYKVLRRKGDNVNQQDFDNQVKANKIRQDYVTGSAKRLAQWFGMPTKDYYDVPEANKIIDETIKGLDYRQEIINNLQKQLSDEDKSAEEKLKKMEEIIKE